MKEQSVEIDFSKLGPKELNKQGWITTEETSILIEQKAASQLNIIRKWNRLSRFQRTLVYASFIITITTVVRLYTSQTKPKSNEKQLDDDVELRNMSGISMAFLMQHQSDQSEEEAEKVVFTGPVNARQYAVVESFRHAWNGYKKYAWGHDNLRPVSGMAYDWFSLGLTIVDSLDTAYIMGLTEEYESGKKWISEELVFTKNKDVNFFEVTIRVLGSLLANFHLSQDFMFLEKALDLGNRMMPAFLSDSGIPYSDVNLGTRNAHSPEWSPYSTTAEVSTIQLEFKELSRLSQSIYFEMAAASISSKIHKLPKRNGLVPIFISPHTGEFLPRAAITLGARGDSYYEYLLKQWIQTGKTQSELLEDYLAAIVGIRDVLAKRSSPNKYLFIGELSAGSEVFNPKMDHLTCFLPGTLALGHANGLPDWHMVMAEELLHTCYLTYAAHPTFLAPEITHFNMASTTDDMYTKAADAHTLLRPEFVESLWYMWQLTGNTTYQEWGWKVFQAFETHAKVPNGYTSLASVKTTKPAPKDMMESFFLAETLKYLYLLFSDDRKLLDLNKYVLNSEAHPLPIHKF